MFLAVCLCSFAQNDPPVRIAFDKNAERIDIVTGEKLPEYHLAQRGSIRFYRGRIDTPENGFAYFFDGRSFQSVDNLALIRKMPALGAWAIVGGGGWQGSENAKISTNPLSICEIEHHAVSFIPLNPKTGKPDPRVYVMLEDMYMFQWRDIDHWVATMGQEEFDAAQGSLY
jgi:hypothetical protein